MSKIYGDQIEQDPFDAPNTAQVDLQTTSDSSTAKAPQIDTTEDAAAIRGQRMATHLKNKGFHPVLIFGGALAGKTSFLTSMLSYFTVAQNPSTTLNLDLTAIPDDDPVWEVNRREAQHLFFRISPRAMNGAPPPQTATEMPFFLPVTLSSPGRAPCGFAFLEGKGEWYLPVDASVDPNPYRPFKGEIEGFLKGFTDSLTVIFVAPCVTDTYLPDGAVQSADSSSLIDRDTGLEGAMKQFRRARDKVNAPDNHLFMLTKWDVICGSVSSPDLLHPDAALKEKEAKTRFKNAWHVFSTNANSGGKSGGQRDRFNATHYSVGVVDRGRIFELSEEDKAKVLEFQRKMWNWLTKVGYRFDLFDDLGPVSLGLVERIVQILRGG